VAADQPVGDSAPLVAEPAGTEPAGEARTDHVPLDDVPGDGAADRAADGAADAVQPAAPAGSAHTEPELPDDIDPRELDREVRNELRTLSGPVSQLVAKRLVASGTLLDDDPEGALAHAMVARRLAPRVASVREAVGLAAYHCGEWATAVAELRTYHRITGRQTHLAIIADCERAQGRPEKAVDLYRAANLDKLEPDESIELLIVAAGARADLGQVDAAAAMLQVPDLADDQAPWAARLRYAFADTLLAAGRRDEAREWFARAAEVDHYLATDAAERLLDMDGVVIDDPDEPTEETTDEVKAGEVTAATGTSAVVEEPAERPAERSVERPAAVIEPAGYAVIFAEPVPADAGPAQVEAADDAGEPRADAPDDGHQER
jgi:tetratricopeptide (TPR) repeat protein